MHPTTWVLVASTAAQLFAAGMALAQVRGSGRYGWFWGAVCAALLLMASRRAVPLAEAVLEARPPQESALLSFLGLAISVLMAVGMWGLRALFQELEAQRRALQRLATVDALSGLASRSYWFEQASRVLEVGRRYGQPAAVMMMDLDNFKQVNDRWGHAAGDHAIASVGALLQAHLRKADLAGRYGGEELAVLMPNTSLPGAAELAERVRSALQTATVEAAGGHVCCTASIGVARMEPEDVGVEAALRRADAALYRAKAQGRNRVVVG